MTRVFLLASAAAICLALGGAAQAQTSLYLELNGGASIFNDSDVDTPLGDGDIEYREAKFNDFRNFGYNAGGAIGVIFRPHPKHWFRTELNGSYRSVRVQDIEIDGALSDGGRNSGQASIATGMLNGFYEHDFGDLAWVRPFIGGGLGVGFVEFEKGRSTTLTNAFILDDDSVEFAWNVSTGLVLPLSDDIELTGAYRLVSTSDVELDATRLGTPTQAEIEIFSHEFVFGLRANF